MPPLPPVTKAMLLICVAMFCLPFIVGSQLQAWLALWPVSGPFAPWQLVSYSFMHANFGHLFFNLIGLWMFGGEMERLWGSRRFLQFYFASAIAAGLLLLLLAAVLGGGTPMMGVSGVIFGLLLAYAMSFPNRTIMPLFPPIPMKAKWFALIFGGLEFALGVFAPFGGIVHFAYLGGMIGAYLMIRYWRGQPPFGRRRR